MSALLHPVVPGFLVALYTSIQHEGGLTPRLVGVAALTAAACVGLPVAALALAFRSGRTGGDLWAARRENRIYFYPAAAVGLGLAFAIFRWLYPFPLAAAMVVSAGGVIAGLAAANRSLKASIHVAGDAAIAAAATWVYGPSAAPLFAMVPLVAWARVAGRHHTPAEVMVGAVVGGIATALGCAAVGVPRFG